jgi:hypothetical protein
VRFDELAFVAAEAYEASCRVAPEGAKLNPHDLFWINKDVSKFTVSSCISIVHELY